MNENRLRERESWSMAERQSRGDRAQQPGMSTLSWVAVAVGAYAAYKMLPSLVRYLRIERM